MMQRRSSKARWSHVFGRMWLLVLLACGAAGCSPAPGQQVAERIRASGSSLVLDVRYRTENILDPAEVLVFLRPGTTEQEAEAFWCEIVVPVGGTHEEGPTGVTLWNSNGTQALAADSTCS